MLSRDERGFASAQWIVLISLTFTFLTWFTNVLFIQYERAATRAAVADAARQAARVSGTQKECEDKIKQVLNDAVPGAAKANPSALAGPTCDLTKDSNAVTASVDYNFSAWFPGASSRGKIAITVQRRNP